MDVPLSMSHLIYQTYESLPVAITDTVQNQLPNHSQGKIDQLHSEFL